MGLRKFLGLKKKKHPTFVDPALEENARRRRIVEARSRGARYAAIQEDSTTRFLGQSVLTGSQ